MGEVHEVTELITPGPAQALAGLLGVPEVDEEQGRSGPLVFVTVRTEVSQDGQDVITEEQDLVYRKPGADNPARSGPSVTAAGRDRAVTVDPVLLFRFSALTYNAHRIHYDREFARGEGYPGPTATRSGCRAATPRTA